MLSSQKMMSAPSGDATYIDDVFSTYLYNGTGSSITNHTTGVNLKDYGGMLWIKMRNNYAGMGTSTGHVLFSTDLPNADVVNDGYGGLSTNSTSAYWARTNYLREFLTTGFKNGTYDETNGTDGTFASWTFRKQEKFFDVVTYTGDGTAGKTISHNLGSTPGCIIIKDLDGAYQSWIVYHRSLGGTKALLLNATLGEQTSSSYWNDTSPTSTQFTLGTTSDVNYSGHNYVAYLFAHDAGGFGTAGTDNVISCGDFSHTNPNIPSINLGFEPQWVLFKRLDGTGSWYILDVMRGMSLSTSDAALVPNTSAAESTASDWINPNATGFTMPHFANLGDGQYIYIAIRRPMKPPTTGTEVFNVQTNSSNGSYVDLTDVGFPPDLVIEKSRSEYGFRWNARLTGTNQLDSSNTNAAATDSNTNFGFKQTQPRIGFGAAKTDMIMESFRRASGFFDVVCYTGTGSARTVTHNLGVAPELMIIKKRSASGSWNCYNAALGNTSYVRLEETSAAASDGGVYWNSTTPTSSVFSIGTGVAVNESGSTLVAYLFATLAGISKVGSYTGTGSTQQINCGFSGGARFVLIKRTDSTGDWYVWDTARGIVSGNDPYLLLNSTAAETTSTDYIDPYSAGFEISSTAPAAINASGGSYIYLAIA